LVRFCPQLGVVPVSCDRFFDGSSSDAVEKDSARVLTKFESPAHVFGLDEILNTYPATNRVAA
jgi:hypothetical protein